MACHCTRTFWGLCLSRYMSLCPSAMCHWKGTARCRCEGHCPGCVCLPLAEHFPHLQWQSPVSMPLWAGGRGYIWGLGSDLWSPSSGLMFFLHCRRRTGICQYPNLEGC